MAPEMMERYADVFSCPGCLPGPGGYDISLEQYITSMQNGSREVAFTLKNDLHRKVAAQEIQSANAKLLVPTSWISNYLAFRCSDI